MTSNTIILHLPHERLYRFVFGNTIARNRADNHFHLHINPKTSKMTKKAIQKRTPSAFTNFWTQHKQSIVSFILGMMLCGPITETGKFVMTVANLPTPEKQAAQGGAAIPFPSDSPLPVPWNMLPMDSSMGSTDSLWMNTSEPPSPSNQQTGIGGAPSTNNSRPPLRRMR